MTTEPAGREDLAGLLERLEEQRPITAFWPASAIPINRDGPEAHAAIIKLEQENAKLRGALPQERGKTLTDVKRLLNSRIEIYRHKLGNESASDETKSEQRFAIEALGIVKQGVINMRHAAEALRADGEG